MGKLDNIGGIMRIKNTLVTDTYASYIYLEEKYKRPLKTISLGNNVYADYDADGILIGIEILNKIFIQEGHVQNTKET